MIGYNPSHLNKNETLLEAFHRVEAYLKANPQYQIYQSSAQYQEGTPEYALSTIIVPEGSKVGKGDVVLFSNVYYAVITAVSETTFSVETATNFRGTTGATPNIAVSATVDNSEGTPSVEVTKSGTNENPSFTLGFHNIKGATGDKGETGLPALMYSKNVTSGPYSSFVTDLDGYNRTPQINDSCVYLSTNNDYFIHGTIEQIFSDRQEASVHIVGKINIEGRQGERGPQGVNGRDGEDGISTLLYAGELSESVTTAEIAQVTMPTDRSIQVYDILISTSSNTFGAMAQVTGLGQTTATVNFIGTLESGGGSGVSDYNELANIPVINQDLSASGFTPTSNTYYRHTGATNGTFTQGVIYLYDTAYHKLGESGGGGGGGTTLNKYTYSFTWYTMDAAARLNRICDATKGKILLLISNRPSYISKQYDGDLIIVSIDMGVSPSAGLYITQLAVSSNGAVSGYNATTESNSFGVSSVGSDKLTSVEITYYNDTEIT